METLQDLLKEAINTDFDHNLRDTTRIINKYTKASKEQKDLIDDIFISVCGWSLETLISNYEKGE